jgi:hypothetical protein
VPKDVQVVAFANVREFMDSDLHRKLATLHPSHATGLHSFTDATGVNPETDIDEVLATLTPGAPGSGRAANPPLVIARGRFDEVRIEGEIRNRTDAHVAEYRGKRVLSFTEGAMPLSVAFLEPGLIAVGPEGIVRSALDAKASGDSVNGNAEVMRLIRDVQHGSGWAVVRFDAIASQGNLPPEIASKLPAITWFSATGSVDGGVSGRVRAEARDEMAANDLRDVLRGFLALARIQTGTRTDFRELIESLQLGGQGTAVTLDFNVPSQVFDALAAVQPRRGRPAIPFPPGPPEPPAPPAPPEPPPPPAI